MILALGNVATRVSVFVQELACVCLDTLVPIVERVLVKSASMVNAQGQTSVIAFQDGPVMLVMIQLVPTIAPVMVAVLPSL